MKIEKIIHLIKRVIPDSLLHRIQYTHSHIVNKWIINHRSEILGFSDKSAMVFSPHQDDETFGCGGMISLKREHGIPVIVVFLTDGSGCGGSQPLSEEKIIEMREREAITALKILGVESSKIHFLQKPDGQLQNLTHEEREKTITQIVEVLKTYQPEEVYVPHRQDCHTDHQVTYELVKEAIKQAEITVDLLQYPIWLFWESLLFIQLKLPDLAAAYRLSISSVQDKKNRAIAAYGSQLECLPQRFVKLFFGSYEIFFKVKL
ncbi:PIG-L deacetylase family protein [Calothrix sp. PCC 7507]|uniref:PIG-L deacetylase family protein n=1 Tax=Calothrix sp. PCC 7507 TaxID=99598 RepID=UPI00029EF1FE|nr:PIG-L deacetylase family protein [Calothrix sp. PCC 7507]AFY32525.1 LmbE family protein [Calothrix sp. PCC 7507]